MDSKFTVPRFWLFSAILELHLAAVFGLSASAAERYIRAYRAAVEDAYAHRLF
ncbi:hypothetical protein [Actinoplanes sp. N902-109]|uniref:hypothetical protein n=1 Tax=Actinoplanes sp. (strain N902-109) TaxID=649831 RepID=UPI00032945F1|nr:hypothetical protein [Actinoplanes sp. N902-109]AGL20081.1 hypothetical protein L083_6571 [Actinoplanes sp. N902-109]